MPRTASNTSRKPHAKPKSPVAAARVAPVNEEPRGELKFDDADSPGRTGDPLGGKALARDLPLRREREAGRTGGEMRGINASDDDVTADDMAPETLLDEEPSHTPDAANRMPADASLTMASVGGIGAGTGLDEAEMASRHPVQKKEAERLLRKAEEHARNPNFFEPAEAAEMASRARLAVKHREEAKLDDE